MRTKNEKERREFPSLGYIATYGAKKGLPLLLPPPLGRITWAIRPGDPHLSRGLLSFHGPFGRRARGEAPTSESDFDV